MTIASQIVLSRLQSAPKDATSVTNAPREHTAKMALMSADHAPLEKSLWQSPACTPLVKNALQESIAPQTLLTAECVTRGSTQELELPSVRIALPEKLARRPSTTVKTVQRGSTQALVLHHARLA